MKGAAYGRSAGHSDLTPGGACSDGFVAPDCSRHVHSSAQQEAGLAQM